MRSLTNLDESAVRTDELVRQGMWESTLLVVTSDNGGDCDIGRWWCDGAHKDFCAQDPSPCGAHKAQDCTHEPDVPPAPKTNFDMFGPSNNYP